MVKWWGGVGEKRELKRKTWKSEKNRVKGKTCREIYEKKQLFRGHIYLYMIICQHLTFWFHLQNNIGDVIMHHLTIIFKGKSERILCSINIYNVSFQSV